MASVNIQFIIHSVIIAIWIESSCGSRTEFDFPNYAKDDRNYADKIHYSRQSSSNLPITLQPPVEQITNFWNQSPHLNSFKRIFFDDFGYINNDKSKIFPTFNGLLDFIRPLYGNISSLKSIKSRNSFKETISEPYKYEYPFEVYITTEKNFLPPPKPIRASIIKLEAVNRFPNFYEPLDYISTPKYYKTFSKFQKNGTEKQNILQNEEFGFYSTSAMNFPTEPSLSFKHVYSDKKFTEPKWSYNLNVRDLNDVTDTINTLISKTHDALEENNVEKNASNVSNVTEVSLDVKNEKEFPAAHNIDSEDNTGFLVTKSVNIDNKINTYLQNPTNKGKIKRVSPEILEQITADTISEKYKNSSNIIINADQIKTYSNGINDNNTGSIMFDIMRPFTNDNSIKIITDLTLAGLSKSKEQSANIQIYTKYLNMSNLIRHELNKLKDKNVFRTRINKFMKNEEDSVPMNPDKISKIIRNDDFNLDLKILRDTNWDGFRTQTSQIFTATPNIPTIIMNLKKTEIDEKQGKTSKGRTSLDTGSVGNNFAENSKNSNNKSVIVETRVSKSITKAAQFLHNMRSRKLPLNTTEKNKDLFHLNREKESKQNFQDVEDFTEKGINKKNETTKYNSSTHLNENTKLLSNAKINNFLNSKLTLTRNLNTSKKSPQNDSKESNGADDIKNRNRRTKYRQNLMTKAQSTQENTYYNSSSINNSFANPEILQKNMEALTNNLDNTKNYSLNNGNHNIILQNTNCEIVTLHEDNEHSGSRKLKQPKSRKKLKRKRPIKRRKIYSHLDDKTPS